MVWVINGVGYKSVGNKSVGNKNVGNNVLLPSKNHYSTLQHKINFKQD